jgi:TetR/AcrR family transcriptional regulator, cholesterol catabolism regulator
MPVVNRPRLAASMARRRRRILDSAVELFHERGYLGATVDDIAARAGVTKRTLYHHLGNKENILGEIRAEFIEAALQRWQAVVDEGGTPSYVVRRLIHEHIRMIAERRGEVAVFLEEAKHLDEARRNEIDAGWAQYESILRDAISHGVDAGEFRADLDVRAATLLILGGLTEMYRWFKPRSRGAEEAVIMLSADLMLEGLEPRSRVA